MEVRTMMKIEEAIERVASRVDDPTTGSGRAVIKLLDALNQCGQGAVCGVLDLDNIEAVTMVLSDPEAMKKLVRYWYYHEAL